ncbi:CG43342 [Drosophila busckii]|uniref:CG43342 n=2 Tax=Drosophila busckii TaxID=30019 RepID=A0A0M4F713_DROBS|nr:CG43342 [Drosophila busckii]
MKTQRGLKREDLLASVIRDRTSLRNYFDKLERTKSQQQVSQKTNSAVMQVQRDSYDLFFESACISIKGLPPKLAAEAKSRISQIITEFELRAISEQEEQSEKLQAVKVKSTKMTDPASKIVYKFKAYT